VVVVHAVGEVGCRPGVAVAGVEVFGGVAPIAERAVDPIAVEREAQQVGMLRRIILLKRGLNALG